MEGKSNAGRGWAGFLLAVVACMALMAGCGAAATGAGSPSASVDCTTAITSLVDCLTYVQNGSKVEKPEGTCCAGLKKVVKTQVSCLCESFKSSADFGVALNITKALGLPGACGVSTPSVSKCKIAGLGASPAPAPQFFHHLAPAPSPSARGGIQGVPAPAPIKAAAPGISVPSTAALVAGVAIAAYLCL